MIDENKLIEQMNRWKELVSKDLHGEMMEISINLFIRIIEQQPKISLKCEEGDENE